MIPPDSAGTLEKRRQRALSGAPLPHEKPPHY